MTSTTTAKGKRCLADWSTVHYYFTTMISELNDGAGPGPSPAAVLGAVSFPAACRVIGKVAADHSHKWVFKEPQEHETNLISSWTNPADSVS